MPKLKGFLGGAAAAAILLSLTSCGGSGSDIAGGTTPPANAANVASVIVDSGPNQESVNTLFTSVTVCVPGSTTECQTIDHIQVDTGSYGLRLMASVLTLTLPVQKATDGNSLVECTVFVDGYSWGPVAAADMKISGESAASLPVQVIGDANFTTVPDTCSGQTSDNAEDTVASFGANGILGIGVFEQDCGSVCTGSNFAVGAYYSCSSTACTPIAAPLINQVQNPVTAFATDNNGTIIELPSVAASGADTVTGSLIFGIDTQSNNASGTQTVLGVDLMQGYFSATVAGTTAPQSFLDSGSNGIYFNTNTTDDPGLVECPATNPATGQPTGFSGFYCPTSTLSISAQLTGTNAVTVAVTFSVGDAQTLTASDATASALPTLAGTYPGAPPNGLDLGLNFFYGRSVYNAIQGYNTKAGTGPYIAF